MSYQSAIANLSEVGFFHGRLSADRAGRLLVRRGCVEGLYILFVAEDVYRRIMLAVCHGSRYVISPPPRT